jgi:RNA polymerase sigma-70 factor (ECF subfamily)
MGAHALAETTRSPRAPNLVAQARAGSFRAFEELYRRHVGRIHSLCLRMTANRERAEELTQEAFTRAWLKLSTFRGESGFPAWLHRVAVNVVIGDGRSRTRRLARERTVGDVEDLQRRAPTGVPGLGLDLDRAIARLPERARAVFVLHDVEGFRHDEIGRMLEIATGTSKAQLHRARKMLREALRS